MAQSILTTPIATTKLSSEYFSFLARKRIALPVRIGGVCKKSVSVTMAALPGLFGDAAVSVAAVLVAAGGPLLAYREINGNNMKYSKFASSEGKKNAAAPMIPSKTGMFLLYFPPALIASVILAGRAELLPLASVLESSFGASGAASYFKDVVVADSDDRLFLLAAALSLHFSKRVLEVLFVHKYSGSITVGETAFIGTSYTLLVSLVYAQMLSTGVDAPFPSLKVLGVVIFLIGITGNAYHHWMLSHLRKDRNKKYVVPHGGLFEFLVCPHYVFEMIDFVGIALISQTLFGWCLAWFVMCYLTGRAITTKEWYMKKVEGFPEDRKVLIPGIF